MHDPNRHRARRCRELRSHLFDLRNLTPVLLFLGIIAASGLIKHSDHLDVGYCAPNSINSLCNRADPRAESGLTDKARDEIPADPLKAPIQAAVIHLQR